MISRGFLIGNGFIGYALHAQMRPTHLAAGAAPRGFVPRYAISAIQALGIHIMSRFYGSDWLL